MAGIQHADIDHTGITGAGGSVATDAIFDAKGDLAVGTGANTAAKLTAGANDTILMADSGQATGLKWVAAATPTDQDYDDVAAAGTADTFARGDHLHGMPSAGGGGVYDYILLRDEKSIGTAGGTATSGSWQTRTLNTEVADTGGDCTLASNQFTLAAGTYRIRAHAPGHFVAAHQARIQNITDTATVAIGTSEIAANAPDGQSYATRSFVEARVTIAGAKAFELQHQVGVTKATNGYGVPVGWGTEVYSVVEIWKEP